MTEISYAFEVLQSYSTKSHKILASLNTLLITNIKDKNGDATLNSSGYLWEKKLRSICFCTSRGLDRM